MNRHIQFSLAALLLIPALPSLATAARAGRTVTRTLQQRIRVPAGDRIVVENLDGQVSVTQGDGPLAVTATVVAGGDQAQTLAQSVKLNVSTSGGRVLIHVHYPLDRYDTLLYNPPSSQVGGDSGEACILGDLICFHGNSHSSVHYQGRRVQVWINDHDRSGAPLYVNLAIQLPAHVTAGFSNAVGLLEADGLANNLSLATQGGDIHLRNLQGQLDARSHGGDVYASGISSQAAGVHTDGGDLTASDLRGDLNLMTSGGDAQLDTIAGKLSLDTGGGDAHLSGDLARLQTLDADTGGGDLTVSGNLAALTALNAESGGGDIVFRASNLSLHLQATSGGGDIHISLPEMHNITSSSGHFSGDIGKAANTGTLDSGGGDITVAQP